MASPFQLHAWAHKPATSPRECYNRLAAVGASPESSHHLITSSHEFSREYPTWLPKHTTRMQPSLACSSFGKTSSYTRRDVAHQGARDWSVLRPVFIVQQPFQARKRVDGDALRD
mmetsp:Transcript_67385/g.133541  ORF Transcript_67385/g.133541 Transcript_67385/m.133541 type:complete len:115 (+) Transcript_67385:217-561(+)